MALAAHFCFISVYLTRNNVGQDFQFFILSISNRMICEKRSLCEWWLEGPKKKVISWVVIHFDVTSEMLQK